MNDINSEAKASTRSRSVWLFSVLCVGYVLTSLDMMIVNVAIPQLQEAFDGAGTAQISWTLNAYTIVFAACLVPAGRLADIFGQKKGFLAGLILFSIASLACALAPNLWTLVATRVLQAVGAAALVPTSMGLLMLAYPGELRGPALRTWTAVGAMAAAMAPIIGGLLTAIDWRFIFIVNVPIGVIAIIAGIRLIPADKQDFSADMPDIIGAASIAGAAAVLVFGLVEGNDYGWMSPLVLLSFIAAALLIVVAVVRSAHHKVPVVPPMLVKIRSFSSANAAAFFFSCGFSLMLISVMMWCQTVHHYSALETGLALAPGTLLMPLFARLTGRLSSIFGAPLTASIGCLILAAGMGWWYIFPYQEAGYLKGVFVGALLTPIGTIVANSALVTIATSEIPAPQLATASGVNLMLRQLGFAVGVASFSAAFIGGNTAESFHFPWVIGIVFASIGAAVSLFCPKVGGK